MSTLSTLKVRPISYEEIAALAENPTTTLDAYEIRSHPVVGDVLVAMTYQVSSKSRLAGRRPAYDRVVYPVVPDTQPGRYEKLRYDSSQEPLGRHFHFDSHSMFGTNSGVTLYTSPEAEQAVALMADNGRDGWHPGNSRLSIAVPDDIDGVETPLMPLYGSQANTSVIVKDVCAEEITARIEKALKAEFGDAVKIQKLKSRPVADIRINVYDFVDGTPLAVNVLEAEAFRIANGSYRTEYVTKDMIVGS